METQESQKLGNTERIVTGDEAGDNNRKAENQRNSYLQVRHCTSFVTCTRPRQKVFSFSFQTPITMSMNRTQNKGIHPLPAQAQQSVTVNVTKENQGNDIFPQTNTKFVPFIDFTTQRNTVFLFLFFTHYLQQFRKIYGQTYTRHILKCHACSAAELEHSSDVFISTLNYCCTVFNCGPRWHSG